MPKFFYWLRLKKDFFKRLEVRKLRRIAGGDTYTVIYLKLLLLSMETDGHLYYEGVEPTLADELAITLDEDTENVNVTLNFLKGIGLLEQISEEEIFLVELPLLVDKETDKAAAMRKLRESRRLALEENSNNVTETVTTLPNVTNCYTDKEKEKEKEKDKEIEKEGDILVHSPSVENTPYDKIVDMFHEICVSLPRIKTLSAKRKKALKKLYDQFSMADIQTGFEKAEASDFLTGRKKVKDSTWCCNFDWLIDTNHFLKVVEGNYDNRKTKSEFEEWLFT